MFSITLSLPRQPPLTPPTMVPTPKWVMVGCMRLDVRWGMMVMMKGEVLIPLGGGGGDGGGRLTDSDRG